MSEIVHDERIERIEKEIKSVTDLKTILLYLKNAPDLVRPKELSKTKMGKNAYTLFRKLEKMGLVKAVVRKRKLTSYKLTEEGLKIAVALEENEREKKETHIEMESPLTQTAMGFLGSKEEDEEIEDEVGVVFGLMPCVAIVKKNKIVKVQELPLFTPIPRDWFLDSEQAIRNFEKFIKSEEGKKFLENLEEAKER